MLCGRWVADLGTEMRVDPLGFTLNYDAATVEFSPSGERPTREYLSSEAALNPRCWADARDVSGECGHATLSA